MAEKTDQAEVEKILIELLQEVLGLTHAFGRLLFIRKQFHLSDQEWLELVPIINGHPPIIAMHLSITTDQMRDARNVCDIAARMLSGGHPPLSKVTVWKGDVPFTRPRLQKWFDTHTLIEPKDGEKDVFVHVTAVERDGLPSLEETQSPITTNSDNAEYVVWYGTNRAPITLPDGSIGYSSNRGAHISHGTCRVFVPKSHKIGSIGSPFWKRLLTLTDDRLKLLSTDTLEASAYWGSLAAKLASVSEKDRQAVVFLHGYNVSFEDAALRTAQIGFDLSIKGAMAFFSWPSQGTLSGYPADEATIEASEIAIADFLTNFATASPAKGIHIIAHSMGNRGLLRAVNRIAERAHQASGKQFDQIILAAPDVDVDVFRQLCDAYARIARRATLYVSQKDRAVDASYWVHQFPRVGYAPPVFLAPGIDTINVTGIDVSLLGHGYVAQARDVLRDMHDLIVNNSPPNRRFGLREIISGTERYWQIGA